MSAWVNRRRWPDEPGTRLLVRTSRQLRRSDSVEGREPRTGSRLCTSFVLLGAAPLFVFFHAAWALGLGPGRTVNERTR